MSASQREADGAVIEGCRLPRGGTVTRLAGLWEGQCDVVGIRSPLIIRQVAAYAGGRCSLESSADVASTAVQQGVRSLQSEAGHLQVIKFRAQPVVHAMTLFASGGEPR